MWGWGFLTQWWTLEEIYILIWALLYGGRNAGENKLLSVLETS